MSNRYFKSTAICLIFTFGNAFAWEIPMLDWNTPCNDVTHPIFEYNCLTEFRLSAGYRQDQVEWTIASPTGSPNILSELQWKDLQILEFRADFNITCCDQIVVRGYGNYGKIMHGRCIDSDFAGDDRTLEFSRSKSNAGKGEVYDLSIGIGYQFHLWQGCCSCYRDWTFTPLVGYSSHQQHLRMNHGVQLINLPDGPVGPFPGLNSNYRAKWKGPWVGFDTTYPICSNFKLFGSYEYHWAHYRGTGHWNLRPDFVKDFRQRANNGRGYIAEAGFSYDFACLFSTGLRFNYQRMNSGSGKDTVFLVSGPLSTKYNGATWQSWSILADIGYAF